MTPEEAENFYEDDEDPAEVFAWFDAGPHGVTAPRRTEPKVHLIAWPWSDHDPWCGRRDPERVTGDHAQVTCKVCVRAAIAAGCMAAS